MSRRDVYQAMGLVGIAMFIVSAFTPAPNLLTRWTAVSARVEPAEAIVVLGSQLYEDGTLSHASVRRALHGIRLYQKGFAPLLVLLGSDRADGRTEAGARAELALELGISPDVMLTDAGARTTREEAIRMRALLGPRGVRRILLVTGPHHMARSQGVFERVGFDVLPAPVADFPTGTDRPEARLQLMRQILQELLARLYYRLAGYL